MMPSVRPSSSFIAVALGVALIAITCGASAKDKPVGGQAEQQASAPDRTVLPPPPPKFQGKIEVALKDSTAEWPEMMKAPKGAPNVLLIMGDDIGYAHMSAFGGPANTRTFDRLAKNGLAFTNFHTTAVCSASRAALITGRNSHSVGMGSTPEHPLPVPGEARDAVSRIHGGTHPLGRAWPAASATWLDEMCGLNRAPLALQVFGDQPPVTVVGLVFAAQ